MKLSIPADHKALCKNTFLSRFKSDPLLISSPGRVNLIGEHTDYHEGFVLPAAIDKCIILAIAPNKLNRIRLHALNMKVQDFEISLDKPIVKSNIQWPDYILGVVDQVVMSGHEVQGFDCVFGGDIPIGAGLSSSAALEGGIVFGLSEMLELSISSKEMALIGQRAENNFVGMKCGIMDQFANIHGKNGQVIRLDCRSLEHTYFPFERTDIKIVLFDTKVRRELTSSGYNNRMEQCETGVSQLQKNGLSIKNLRDVSLNDLTKFQAVMDPVIFKRCRYVIEENSRVLKACDDLLHNDMASFGRRMLASHYGLKDDYEVSCVELDTLVEAAKGRPGVLGARMMGGGFGGCTINIIEEHAIESVTSHVSAIYNREFKQSPGVHIAAISEGTHIIR